MMITAEVQKGHTYYRCTKKGGVHCSQPYVREETLDAQLSATLQEFVMPQEWATELSKLAEKDERETLQSAAVLTQETRAEIQTISQKLQRLLDAYLEQDIEQETYRSEKASLLSRKKSLKENMADLESGSIAWLEPLRGWIKDASMLDAIAESDDLPSKKSSFQKIFGSNLSIRNREIVFSPIPPYASLREARKNFPETGLCTFLVPPAGIEPTSFP
ncbi:MAG: zinc ribbon domain-containing protein [Patescibacteria group bacterium]|nr:zinc ribbon domain-containing protein [Patescibacteria group bacterium]